MSTTFLRATNARQLQLATFAVGDLLLGIEIDRIQEINRQLDITPVPRAPSFVRGVINLRGEVVSVIDPRTILGLPPADVTRSSRNLVIQSRGELIGLMVDRIADILSVSTSDIDAPPAHIQGVDGRFFKGVHTTDKELVVLIDLDELLGAKEA